MNENQPSKKEIKKKEFKEYIDITDKRVLDTRKADIELLGKDEVFVQVKDTTNYWISNYGRLVNNRNGKFNFHKAGNAHYTIQGEGITIDTYTYKLVANHFLEKVAGCPKIWHIDGDKNNCHYKNLMYVNDKEIYNLSSGVWSKEDLDREQEYIQYITVTRNSASMIYNMIYQRCCSNNGAYGDSFMCDKWLKNKESFDEWYNAGYYECDGESMAVDKDLLFPGNKEYCPEKCCIIPQTINTMLSNCKKHYTRYKKNKEEILPLGVRYDKYKEMYYGEIRPCGWDSTKKLSYWKTPEEAFNEYKRFKQADILMVALKYKDKVPKNVYDALLKVDVQPY